MKVYLAGPIFSEADQDWLRSLKERIERFAEENRLRLLVVWPYELMDAEASAKLGALAKSEIFRLCRSHLEDTDVLVACLDGSQVDDGTAWEIGYYFALKPGKSHKILGIRTDFRRAGETDFSKVNLMIEESCDVLVNTRDELISSLERLLSRSDSQSHG
jgi:nucleoside 2-deoxyribosyltransferase